MGVPLTKREVVAELASAVGTDDGQMTRKAPNRAEAPRQITAALTTPTGPNLSAEDRATAERRFAIIEPLIAPKRFLELWSQHGNKKGPLMAALASKHGVKRSTLYNWLGNFENGGIPALVVKSRADKGKPRSLNAAAREFLQSAAFPRRGAYGTLSVKEIFRQYCDERAWRDSHSGKRLTGDLTTKYAKYLDEDDKLRTDARLPEASYATFSRWFLKIPLSVRVMARQGEEAFASTEILSFREISALSPLDYVVMDHRQLDVFCLDQQTKGGWKLIRPWLTAAIDMRTRKWLAWVIVQAPSSDSIASVLKKLFLTHGLPKACYWDNGKDFRCEWLEGEGSRSDAPFKVGELREGMRGVLDTLGVRVHHAIVRRARSKIIEPNFGNTSAYDRSLPWWCGHKPSQRPERLKTLVADHERWVKGEIPETPFPTIAKVSWLYDDFLGNDLNEREHSGEGMRKLTPTGTIGWMSPNEAWELLIRNVPRREVSQETISFCFYKRRESIVRHGEIKTTFSGVDYHYRISNAPTKLMALNGCQVEFAYDPYDLETVAIFHDSRFIVLASNLELRRMGEQTFVEDERNRRAVRREVKAFIQNVHSAVPVASAEERALRRLAIAPSRQEPPRPLIQCEVPASIADAVDAICEDRKPFVAGQTPLKIEVVKAANPEGNDDDKFNFFS